MGDVRIEQGSGAKERKATEGHCLSSFTAMLISKHLLVTHKPPRGKVIFSSYFCCLQWTLLVWICAAQEDG